MLNTGKLLFLLLIIIVFPVGLSAGNLKIYTENFPPYNYEKDGRIVGASTDIVKLIIEKTGSNSEINVTSWNRCLKAINQNTEPVAVYSMGLTKKREPLYKWVGPIIVLEVGVYTRKDLNVEISNLNDVLNSGLRICANRDSPIFNKLVGMGFPSERIDLTHNNKLNFKKLIKRRSDFWITGTDVFRKIAELEGYDISKVKYLFTAWENGLYIAFNQITPDNVIKKWQDALDSIDDMDKQKIFKKYKIK